MKSKGILIIGDSASGKSASIRNLPTEETFIINVVGKDLPFKTKGYKSVTSNPNEGNVLETDDFNTIIKIITHISEKRPEIKTIVIDDVQYIYANEFMRRISEKGFDKFNEIGYKIWAMGMKMRDVRDDLIIFMLSHSETTITQSGEKYIKAKTIGKLVDEKITLEGLFTVVLMSTINVSKDSGIKYGFITHGDGTSTVKSPIGMFEEDFIDNDLNKVKTKYLEYYGD